MFLLCFTVDAMFGAMSSCQALHPDDDDSVSEGKEHFPSFYG